MEAETSVAARRNNASPMLAMHANDVVHFCW